MYVVPTIMEPRGLCYFTPVLWKALAPELEREVEEWRFLRERFARVRQGDFAALGDLLDIYPRLKSPATRLFATNLLGDAGTDEQLEAVEVFIVESVFDPSSVCDLCHSLGLWGRLSGVESILCAYDRHFPGQLVEGLPAYLTTMLESEFGPAADYPARTRMKRSSRMKKGFGRFARPAWGNWVDRRSMHSLVGPLASGAWRSAFWSCSGTVATRP